MMIGAEDTILFTGDSITDCQRLRDQTYDLGRGYVLMTAGWLKLQLASRRLKIYNRGISGNRIYDLEARLEPDLLRLQPTVVSILIGINDTWRRYDRNQISSIEEFRASYARILEKIRTELNSRVVLMAPFLLPVPADRALWREDLNPRIAAVRSLAHEFQVEYIALDELFTAAAQRAPDHYWLPDGVHPSPAGHALIAQAWLQKMGFYSGP